MAGANPAPLFSGAWLCLMSLGGAQLEFTSPSPPCWFLPRNGGWRWVRVGESDRRGGSGLVQTVLRKSERAAPFSGRRAKGRGGLLAGLGGHSTQPSGRRRESGAFISSVSTECLPGTQAPPLASLLCFSHHRPGPPDLPLVTCVLSIFLGNATHSDHFPKLLSPSQLPCPQCHSPQSLALWGHTTY